MKVFIDTSAWIALYDKNDKYHNHAKKIWTEIINKKIQMYTTFDILDETITLLRFRIGYKNSVDFGKNIFTSKIIHIIEINTELRTKAWEYYNKFSDKKLSFTDCTSFAAMSVFNITKTFTFDNHFKQVGFIVLEVSGL